MTFDPAPYVEAIKRQNETERLAIAARLEEARTEARRLAARIKANDPGLRSVTLFGSVAEGNPVNLSFDIDLALDGGDVYKAMDITENSSFSVDIVDIRLLPEHVRLRILERGIIVG